MGCLSERVNSVKGTLKHRGAIPGNVLILEHPQEYHRALAAELSCRFGRWSRSLIGKRHIEVRDRPHGHALNPPAQRPGPVAILGRLTFRLVDSTRRSRSPWGA